MRVVDARARGGWVQACVRVLVSWIALRSGAGPCSPHEAIAVAPHYTHTLSIRCYQPWRYIHEPHTTPNDLAPILISTPWQIIVHIDSSESWFQVAAVANVVLYIFIFYLFICLLLSMLEPSSTLGSFSMFESCLDIQIKNHIPASSHIRTRSIISQYLKERKRKKKHLRVRSTATHRPHERTLSCTYNPGRYVDLTPLTTKARAKKMWTFFCKENEDCPKKKRLMFWIQKCSSPKNCFRMHELTK